MIAGKGRASSAALTFGSRVVLDAAPGVVWAVEVRRRLDEVGDRSSSLAYVSPVSLDGERVGHSTAVPIGRARRSGVYVELGFGQWMNGEFDPARLRVNAIALPEPLTDRQRATLTAEIAALEFDLPELTGIEIFAHMLRIGRTIGERAGRDAGRAMPDRFRRAPQPGEPLQGGHLITAAMHATPDGWAKFADTAAEAFRSELADDIKHY